MAATANFAFYTLYHDKKECHVFETSPRAVLHVWTAPGLPAPVSRSVFSLVQLSCSVAAESLRPHELQHVRPPCPSLTPIVYSNPWPLSRGCHPTISFSVIPFSSHLQSVRVFSNESALHIRWPKNWNFSFSISPSNEYSGLISFRMDWLDLLAVQGEVSRAFSNTTVQKYQFFSTQLSLWFNSHIHT